MFDKYLELYLLKMESIKLIEETIENNMPNRIGKEIEKYKDAILMDIYFDQILSEKIDSRVESYMQKFVTINEVNKDDKKISYKFKRKGDSLNKQKNIEESRKVVSIGYYTLNTMYNNILISILIEFENIMTRIFEKVITKYPDAYLDDTKVSYAEIIKVKDIGQIKREIVSNEVNQLMRESIFKWIRTLEKKHKLTISLENQYIKNFIEAYLRRNIIVHNESRINIDYINGMKTINKDIPESMIGENLNCTKEYIDKIIDSSIYLIIYIINQILILFKEENESFTSAILNMGFEKIKNEEYDLAREIFRLLKDNKTLDQQTKVYSLINYWQTYKWTDRYEEIRNELEKFDISAYEELIKLAVYALMDDYEKIENILSYEFNEEKQNEELAIELEDFPVFKQLRKQKFYQDLKEKYPDVFAIKSTQINEENEEERKGIVKNSNGKFQATINIVRKNIPENNIERIMAEESEKDKDKKNKEE